MAERWITDIVTETGGLHDHAQISRRDPVRQPFTQQLADDHAQAAPHAAHFQGVRQTGVDMIVIGQWMYLGLAPQSTKRAGKDDSVVILVKWAAADLIAATGVLTVQT